MNARRVAPTLVVLFALVVVGCGDDGGGDGPTTTAATTQSTGASVTTAASGGESPTSGDAGTATVDGTTYSFRDLYLCEFDEELGFELELQARGATDGGAFQLDLVIGSFAGSPFHDVSWFGPEGIYSGSGMQVGETWVNADDGMTQLDGPPISTDGGVASGSATLTDVTESGDPIEISFSVPIPTEFFACR